MKIWLFRFIALCLPLVFLGLLEGGLRIIDYGKSVPLFIDNPAHPDYQLARPDIITRYFSSPEQAPNVTLEPTFFLKQKPQNGVRLVVQGGSTAAGFPYGLGASLAGMLEQRLRQSLPTQHVEVINTALSAVNSYTLLDLSDDIIDIEPDAVLIYAGHNEYLGILGVGSNYSSASNPAITQVYLAIKDLRLFQLLQNTYALFASRSASAGDSESSRTLMARIAKHKDIPLTSPLYNAGIEQFSTNIRRLVSKYQQNGIPVFIATVASNLANQAPFASTELSDEEKQVLKRATNEPGLFDAFVRDAAVEAHSAEFWFELAGLALQRRKPDAAKTFYTRAKDSDLLRFRAPEAINQIIKTLGDVTNVTVVDAEAHLRSRSPNGIIGNELMLEHLHPNLQGYFLLADSFYNALQASGEFTPWQTVSIDQAWRDRPVLPAEEYMGYATIKRLMSDYPFTDQPQLLALPRPTDPTQQLGLALFEKRIDWLAMAQQSLQLYRQQNNRSMVVKISRLLADALPHDPQANAKAAALMQEQNNYIEALYYLQRSQRAGNVTPGLEEQITNLKSRASTSVDL